VFVRMLGKVVVVVGVTACGKTTVGKLLVENLKTNKGKVNEDLWKFYDADEFHSDENKAKMHQGIPLQDEDRLPWLLRLQQLIRESIISGQNIVLACSALKRSYRAILVGLKRDLQSEITTPENLEKEVTSNVAMVYLRCSESTIQKRIEKRKGHFMSVHLVRSQFDTWQDFDEIEQRTFFVIIVDVKDEDQAGDVSNKICQSLSPFHSCSNTN